MRTISLAGFVDNGKTEFAKKFVSNPQHLDAVAQEKKYKMTIHTNIQYIINNRNSEKYILLDNPGHNILFSKLFSSAALADIHILVVSARTEDGGLKHLDTYLNLYNTLLIKKLIIVVSKIDLVTTQEVYNCIQKIRDYFVNFTLYILPFSYKLDVDRMKTLLLNYIEKFEDHKIHNGLVLKSYNINRPKTKIDELVGATIGIYSDTLPHHKMYLGPILLKNNNYKTVEIDLESIITHENIHTANTNLAFTRGMDNKLTGTLLLQNPFELSKEISIFSKNNYNPNSSLIIIIKHFQTIAKVKSIRNKLVQIILDIPVPIPLLEYPVYILSQDNYGWNYKETNYIRL